MIAVQRAIAHWERFTSLKFNGAGGKNQILFRGGEDGTCYSHMGKQGGVQEIILGNGCGRMHMTIHETGHAVGLWHEQAREDRDDYIAIHWDNITPDSKYNFDKYTDYGFLGFLARDAEEIGPYDYNSAMHYSSFAESKNGKPTMPRKDGTTFGRSRFLSPGDINGIRKLYGFGAAKVWNQDSFSPIDQFLEVGRVQEDNIDHMFSFDKPNSDVYISVSGGVSFGKKTRVNRKMCNVDEVCRVGDVNGDGWDNIVLFTRGNGPVEKQHRVKVAINNQSKQSNQNNNREFNFSSPVDWHTDFGDNDDVMKLGDVNGDGKADLIAFNRTNREVWVAESNGNTFTGKSKWHNGFCLGTQICDVGDFNGDGRTDIVMFTRGPQREVWISLKGSFTQGSGVPFKREHFGVAQRWHSNFGPNGYSMDVGDMDGDGNDDIITFRHSKAASQVWFAPSNGRDRMGKAIKIQDDFCRSNQKCVVGDFNGSGLADLGAVNGTITVSH